MTTPSLTFQLAQPTSRQSRKTAQTTMSLWANLMDNVCVCVCEMTEQLLEMERQMKDKRGQLEDNGGGGLGSRFHSTHLRSSHVC